MPVTLLTDLAETKLATAAGSGSQVAITHIALGDANGVTYDPAADATTLQNERARRAIDSTAFQGGNTWIVKAEFPTDTPSFAVREIGFFDQDGDLIAIWAGADVDPRQTGVIVYLVEHALSFSRVAEGLIIVDAPLDNEIYPGQMVLAKSGLSFPGWLECDGSEYDAAAYPELVAHGDVRHLPPDTIDLGASGTLTLPVAITINGEQRYFYFWGGSFNGTTLRNILNDGAEITEALADREAALNGVTVRLPTLGDPSYNEGDAFSSTLRAAVFASPEDNQTYYDDMFAVWDAFNGASTGTGLNGVPPGWLSGNYWSSTLISTDTSAKLALNTGYRSSQAVSASASAALEVRDVQLNALYLLPDSSALGAPDGYSYYIRHGGV